LEDFSGTSENHPSDLNIGLKCDSVLGPFLTGVLAMHTRFTCENVGHLAIMCECHWLMSKAHVNVATLLANIFIIFTGTLWEFTAPLYLEQCMIACITALSYT
jgi:hypothetical protein